MKKPDGGLAFPCDGVAGGMSLRDYFAGQALLGETLHSRPAGTRTQGLTETTISYHNTTRETWVASRAYAIADAMLAEREKDA